jgi:hypothetical protein
MSYNCHDGPERQRPAAASVEIKLHRLFVIFVLAGVCSVSTASWGQEKSGPATAVERLIVADSVGGSIGLQDKTTSGTEKEDYGAASHRRSREKPAREPAHRSNSPDRSQGGSRFFSNPSSHGVGIDGCMTGRAGGCGQDAANVFCRGQGFSRATEFKVGFKSRTYRQGDGDFCTGTCSVFTEIQCN